MGYQINSYYKSQYTGQQIENALSAFKNMASEYSQNESYNVGDVVLYGNGLYVCTGSTTGTFDPTKWQQTTLAEIFANLGATYTDPNNDGNVVVGVDSTTGTKTIKSISFPSLTNKYVFPFAQYIRTEAANDPDNAVFDVEIPDAEEAPMHSTVIKGKTVAVNQLSRPIASATTVNGITVTPNADGSVTLNGTATASGIVTSFRNIDAVNGHSYYIKMVSSASVSGLAVYTLIGGSTGLTEGTRTAIATGSQDVTLRGDNGAVYNNVKVFVMTTDLTARGFTSAETTNVATLKTAWLKKYGYPLPQYIPYDAGSLANVNGEYRVRGRNLWDGQRELGSYDPNGQKVASGSVSRNVNPVKVEPNKTYYTNHGFYIYFYDANMNFISLNNTGYNTFTTPENACYINFRQATNEWSEYDTIFNVSDASFNGTYEAPYNGGEIGLINIWDEEWESGVINSDGSKSADATRIRSKNYIPVMPNTTYYYRQRVVDGTGRAAFYDANYQFISFISSFVINSEFTTPANAWYMLFCPGINYGTEYTYDICINRSNSLINGKYFPYCAPLNGVGTAQDEKDFATGKRNTRCDMGDLGTLNWTAASSGNIFYVTGASSWIKFPPNINTAFNGVCGKYQTTSYGDGTSTDKSIYTAWTGAATNYLYIHDSAYSDAATLKAALSGTYLCYEAITPTTTTETPQPVETQYGYNVLEPVSGGVQSAEVDTVYYENIAGYIDKKLAEG